MNREEKAAAISEFTEGIGQATNAFLIDFKGITVPQVTELRKQVRESGSSYVVVKNTLALIAVKDSPLDADQGAVHRHDRGRLQHDRRGHLAKALTKFAKDVPAVQFKGAMLDGQIVPASEIQNIANLPVARRAGRQAAVPDAAPDPRTGHVLPANIRNLAVVLDQIAKQKETVGGADRARPLDID